MPRKKPSELGLWKLNTPYNEVEDSDYFIIEGLNAPCGYGKHKIYLSIINSKDPDKLKLKQYSNIAFEHFQKSSSVNIL